MVLVLVGPQHHNVGVFGCLKVSEEEGERRSKTPARLNVIVILSAVIQRLRLPGLECYYSIKYTSGCASWRTSNICKDNSFGFKVSALGIIRIRSILIPIPIPIDTNTY